jgi:hypothetical protein
VFKVPRTTMHAYAVLNIHSPISCTVPVISRLCREYSVNVRTESCFKFTLSSSTVSEPLNPSLSPNVSPIRSEVEFRNQAYCDTRAGASWLSQPTRASACHGRLSSVQRCTDLACLWGTRSSRAWHWGCTGTRLPRLHHRWHARAYTRSTCHSSERRWPHRRRATARRRR